MEDSKQVEGVEPVRIKLVCWGCGAGKDVQVPHEPRFAFELVGWAQAAGMVGFIDHRHQRSLIFCNADHARAQLTKKGWFRLSPATPAATDGGEG